MCCIFELNINYSSNYTDTKEDLQFPDRLDYLTAIYCAAYTLEMNAMHALLHQTL